MSELDPVEREIEALLFLSSEPITEDQLAAATEVEVESVRAGLESLESGYLASKRGIVLRRIAGGWALASNPEAEDSARRLFASPRTPPLTPAQAETLAIIAYLQPVSRPEIARIRGVNAESAAALLIERGLIEEAGRSPFGAVLYRTSELFLRLFGLESLSELPDISAWDPSPEIETALRERLLEIGAQRAGQPIAGEQLATAPIDAEDLASSEFDGEVGLTTAGDEPTVESAPGDEG